MTLPLAPLEGTINTILTKALEVTQITGDFLVEQTPDVIQQLLIWKGVYSGIVCFISIALLLLMVFKWIPETYESCKKYDSDGILYELEEYTSALAFWLIPLLIVLYKMNLTWLKILVAPKLYLLEYATSLVK